MGSISVPISTPKNTQLECLSSTLVLEFLMYKDNNGIFEISVDNMFKIEFQPPNTIELELTGITSSIYFNLENNKWVHVRLALNESPGEHKFELWGVSIPINNSYSQMKEYPSPIGCSTLNLRDDNNPTSSVNIRELRIWRRGVQDIYTGDPYSIYQLLPPKVFRELLFYMPMNEGVGTTIHDFSPLGSSLLPSALSWAPTPLMPPLPHSSFECQFPGMAYSGSCFWGSGVDIHFLCLPTYVRIYLTTYSPHIQSPSLVWEVVPHIPYTLDISSRLLAALHLGREGLGNLDYDITANISFLQGGQNFDYLRLIHFNSEYCSHVTMQLETYIHVYIYIYIYMY